MRVMSAALILPLLAGSAAAETAPALSAQAAIIEHDQSLLRGPEQPTHCRDRIEVVRDEDAMPRLNRDNARPDDPEVLMFYAVQRRATARPGPRAES